MNRELYYRVLKDIEMYFRVMRKEWWRIMADAAIMHEEAKSKLMDRLHELLELQKKIENEFGENRYNIFVFGSYLTTKYVEEQSDIDIAIYAEDFDLYKRLSLYLEEYYNEKGIQSDIFFIDITMEAPVYCAPLKSKVQFTDYFPQKLSDFEKKCERKLEEIKARLAG